MLKHLIYATALAATLSACSSDEDVLNTFNTKDFVVALAASSDGNAMEYPVSVSAYTTSGTLVKSTQITEEGSTTEMSLQKGDYTIVASSGDNDFTNGYTTAKPLRMATRNITLNKDLTEALTLTYKVARVNVTLNNISDKATAVSVTMGPLHNSLTWKGEGSGSITPTINCTKDSEGKWSTGTFYVLPTNEKNTTITIKQVTSDETKDYNIAISEVIQKNKTYTFTGSYDDTYANYKLQLTLSAADWAENISKDFTFNDNNTTTTTPGTPTTPSETPSETPSAGASLTAGTVWNGHIVALVNGNTATLLSTKEWRLSSASERPSELNTYVEGDYSGWRLPTEDEALALYESYHFIDGKLAALNTVLKQNNITEFGGDNTDVVYVCGEDGNSAISFISSPANIFTTASSPKKKYRIRLVKTITINK